MFDVDNVPLVASDFDRDLGPQGDAEQHMRELLSGAIGEGEEDVDGDDDSGQVEGLRDGLRLLPHQVRGVRWMRGRESGKKRGGILADDMGLGKTVQAIATIVGRPATSAERKQGYAKSTLCIVPSQVLKQWADECTSKTQKGRLSVLIHHGPTRTKSEPRSLLEADVRLIYLW